MTIHNRGILQRSSVSLCSLATAIQLFFSALQCHTLKRSQHHSRGMRNEEHHVRSNEKKKNKRERICVTESDTEKVRERSGISGTHNCTKNTAVSVNTHAIAFPFLKTTRYHSNRQGTGGGEQGVCGVSFLCAKCIPSHSLTWSRCISMTLICRLHQD